MDVDITVLTEIDRRKDSFLIFSTGKTLNERFTTKCGLTLMEDFVVSSEIPALKEKFVSKLQTYKKHDNVETDKRRAEMETRKELEESLRLFSKRRRTASSLRKSPNEKSTISHSKPETNYSAEKTKPFSINDLESTKKHIKQEFCSDRNEFSFDDFELTKPVRNPEINSSEVTSTKKMKQFSRGDFESMKPYRKAKMNRVEVASDTKGKRIPFGDFQFTKPLKKHEIISSEVSSNEIINKFSTTDLESVKSYRKKERNVTSGRKVKLFSIGDSKSTKPICDENMNQILSDDLDLINSSRKTETNSFEITSSSSETSRISSGDSKSLPEFTNNPSWSKIKSSENESISNSDCNFRDSGTFKRPWSYRNNYVSSAAEIEYFRNRSYDSYGFHRNNNFNSPYHYYRKDFQEVQSYSWNSSYQRNLERPTKEQLDDEIDQYMSEVKLKPTSAKEDDLDSFVKEYFMETEKVLRESDYEFDSQKLK